jgi:hypothetical protein
MSPVLAAEATDTFVTADGTRLGPRPIGRDDGDRLVALFARRHGGVIELELALDR